MALFNLQEVGLQLEEWWLVSCGAITGVSPGFNHSNSEEYFHACSCWTSDFSFYGSCKLNSSFVGFVLLPASSTHFTFSSISLLQSVPLHGWFGSSTLSKRGDLYPSGSFQGSIANPGNRYSFPVTHSSAVSLKKFIVLIVWLILLSSSLSNPRVLWNLTADISADHM